MAKYTTEVRTICEYYANPTNQTPSDFMDVSETIQAAIPSIFNFTFPIFDEDYLNPLETKILMHYYTREIGLETVGLWKLKLQTKLNEIMPYYNQLYLSAQMQFDPFSDVDLTTTRSNENNTSENQGENANATSEQNTTASGSSSQTTTGNESSSSTSTNDSNNTTKDAYSDTPQGQITNVDNYTYLTNYRNKTDSGSDSAASSSTGESTTNSTSNSSAQTETNNTSTNKITRDRSLTSTDDYLEKITGKRGTASYSAMLEEYRKTFLNIDMQVIGDLEELFMGVW